MSKHSDYAELQENSRKLDQEKNQYNDQITDLEKTVLSMPEDMQYRIME